MLTDLDFTSSGYADMVAACRATSVPVLQRDWFLHPLQVHISGLCDFRACKGTCTHPGWTLQRLLSLLETAALAASSLFAPAVGRITLQCPAMSGCGRSNSSDCKYQAGSLPGAIADCGSQGGWRGWRAWHHSQCERASWSARALQLCSSHRTGLSCGGDSKIALQWLSCPCELPSALFEVSGRQLHYKCVVTVFAT